MGAGQTDLVLRASKIVTTSPARATAPPTSMSTTAAFEVPATQVHPSVPMTAHHSDSDVGVADNFAGRILVGNPEVKGRKQNQHRFQPRSGAPTSKGYKQAGLQGKRERKNTAKGASYQKTLGKKK